MGVIILLFLPIIEKYNQSNNRIFQTCQFVFNRVIPTETNLTAWLQDCRRISNKKHFESEELEKQLELGNQILAGLKVSHLELFNQKENDAIWSDTDLENGIDARFMDGELVVTRVYPKSEANRKGLQRGDRVVLQKSESLSPYQLNHWKGKLTIERRKKVFQVNLVPEMLSIQRDMSVAATLGVVVLSIESFKSQYFGEEKISLIRSKIKSTDKIIVDLRGNNGGNFVAGLRLLSIFICQPTTVGFMKKNRDLGRIGFFENNLGDEYQIEVLNRNDSVGLRTFESKECLPKPVAVLIDAQSKSTAEWVALAFKDVLSVPLFGATSAGELLVGIWYDISHIWNHVVKLSIPEAYYESLNGFLIEGTGVPVDRTLYPSRVDYEQGFDSEIIQIEKAMR